METVIGWTTIFTLICGGFAYTFSLEKRVNNKFDSLPSKDDMKRLEEQNQQLQDRIDTLYEHLLSKPMPIPKNGN